MQAIILAGGMGKRLRPVAGDAPKAMLDIAGKPLLAWQIERLHAQGVNEIVLCLRAQDVAIRDYFGELFSGVCLRYSIEEKPLGTGGAIRAALRVLKTRKPVFVLHADAVADVDIKRMRGIHISEGRSITMAAKQGASANMRLVVSADGAVTGDPHRQSESRAGGTGMYVVSPQLFDSYPLPKTFSFESDFLVPHMETLRARTFSDVRYFLDVNKPCDYERALAELPQRFGVKLAA